MTLEKTELLQKWSLPWPVMQVLIGGQSSIDLPSLNVKSWDEATAFIRGYGYDPCDARDQLTIHSTFVEAISFIDKVLINDADRRAGVAIPNEILAVNDARRLLLWASEISPKRSSIAAWACAALRVMHTIAHIEGMTRYTSIDVAREQIFSRFLKHIFRTEDGTLRLGDPADSVQIERIEWKNHKERHSIILKLLHKRGNVAETIYDQLGIRIITTRWCDVIMAVKYLRQFHMITFANCVPSRSANTLVDLDKFRVQLETIREMLVANAIKPAEFEAMISRLETEIPEPERTNPHSSQAYRSIQLTCRQLIRQRNPLLSWLDKLRRDSDVHVLPKETQDLCAQLIELVEGWHSVRESRDVEAFFPFEVQIMDSKSYQEVLAGSAKHDAYKRSQLRAARKRVLAGLVEIEPLIKQ